MEVIKCHEKIYVIDKIKYEPRERFIRRAWFVIKLLSLTDISYNDAIRISKLWANVKYLGCEYSEKIMNELNLFEKTIDLSTSI